MMEVGATGKIIVNRNNQRHPGSDILLLGGTSTALKLARDLLQQGHKLTYSIAGLVRQPDLPCKVISGGFTQYGGMTAFISTQKISLIIDATHPYAVQISSHATAAANECNIPCWRLQRPGWQPQNGDNWHWFLDWDALLLTLKPYKRIFLSQGQPDEQQLQSLRNTYCAGQQYYLRTAIPTKLDLPAWTQSIHAIGPFAYQDELSLFQTLGIDVLVSKNSGGAATYGKIQAARELGIPVLMLKRPHKVPVTKVFASSADLLAVLRA